MSNEISFDQTAAEIDKDKRLIDNFQITKEEEKILQNLAKRVAGLSKRSIEQKKKKLWFKHNDLHPTRPLVFIDPENGWNEIITKKQLKCKNQLLRSWEMRLLKEIYWGENLKDDRVIRPYFDINYCYDESGYGLKEKRIRASEEGSFKYDPPLKEYEKDFSKLKFPNIEIDYKLTENIINFAKKIFGDILEIRLKGKWLWTSGMTWDFISLRGLDNFMFDMYDNPEWVHRVMQFLQEGVMRKLDFLEKNNLLSLNTGGTYVGSGGFGWTTELPQDDFDLERVRTIDMWGFAESQETVGISPDMFKEFIFPYQKPILDRFGLNCYGCCEPLEKRWHIVEKFPRLRRVSVSPWADKKAMSEYLGQDYIYSLKPSPTPLAQPKLDENIIRKNIRQVLQITKDNIVEIIMKDNHTLGNNPENATRWVEIVREEIDKMY